MEVAFENRGGELLVELIGELDHHAAKGIGQKIDFEICIRRPASVCLDFGKLAFMDSSGLAVIMGRRRTCMEIGIPICLTGVSGSIRKVLLMSGIQKYIKMKEYNYESR